MSNTQKRLKSFIKLVGIVFLLIMSFEGFAQKETIDVIYLKNGSIIRGEIVEILADGRVKVESLCDNVWYFSTDEIEKMLKEDYEFEPKQALEPKAPKKYFEKGLFSNISASLLQGRESEEMAVPYVGFMFLSGYQWQSGFSVGGGLGMEIFDQSYMPFVVDTRYLMKKGRIGHFVYMQGGYSYSLDQSDDYYEEYEPSWGYLINPGLGIKINLNSRNSFNLSVGFRYQVNELKYTDYNGVEVIRTKQYSRVMFTFSYCFR